MKYIKQLIAFIKDVSNDVRIPDADKKILLVLIALIISPIDLIPDWIPFFGMLDDIVILGVVLDYFFNHLDQVILLSHYPWDMKSYIRVRKFAHIITFLTPDWIKHKIWKFKPSVYLK
ncbi:MAG: YkvA family protein [Oligoflexia bacterium]|nr:YkvA family protein [Oligoflexia bacterium]